MNIKNLIIQKKDNRRIYDQVSRQIQQRVKSEHILTPSNRSNSTNLNDLKISFQNSEHNKITHKAILKDKPFEITFRKKENY